MPDHATFSKTRRGRFRDANLLRELFEIVVRRCMVEGLVGGEGFAVDASMTLIANEGSRRPRNSIPRPSEPWPSISPRWTMPTFGKAHGR